MRLQPLVAPSTFARDRHASVSVRTRLPGKRLCSPESPYLYFVCSVFSICVYKVLLCRWVRAALEDSIGYDAKKYIQPIICTFTQKCVRSY